MTGSAVQSDLGPVCPSRSEVYRQAHQVRDLAALAVECTLPGKGIEDVARAQTCLARARAILGETP